MALPIRPAKKSVVHCKDQKECTIPEAARIEEEETALALMILGRHESNVSEA